MVSVADRTAKQKVGDPLQGSRHEGAYLRQRCSCYDLLALQGDCWFYPIYYDVSATSLLRNKRKGGTVLVCCAPWRATHTVSAVSCCTLFDFILGLLPIVCISRFRLC